MRLSWLGNLNVLCHGVGIVSHVVPTCGAEERGECEVKKDFLTVNLETAQMWRRIRLDDADSRKDEDEEELEQS